MQKSEHFFRLESLNQFLQIIFDVLRICHAQTNPKLPINMNKLFQKPRQIFANLKAVTASILASNPNFFATIIDSRLQFRNYLFYSVRTVISFDEFNRTKRTSTITAM